MNIYVHKYILYFLNFVFLLLVLVNSCFAFEENFDSLSSLNNYEIYSNGGSVSIISGNLVLSQSVKTKTYPYVRLLNTLIPSQISSISIRYSYPSLGVFGAGIVLDNVYPINGNFYDVGSNSIAWTWNLGNPPYSIIGGLFPGNIYRFENQNGFHVISLLKTSSGYDLYLDDVYINRIITSKLVSSIWFGNPHFTSSNDTWPTIYIDYIKISSTNQYHFYYSQVDDLWKDDLYDTATNWSGSEPPTIGRWGCALTSVAMILKNYGVKSPLDGAVSTPKILNTWLINAPDGYIRDGLINWVAVTRYVKLSRDANQAPTALEFQRQKYQASEVDAKLTLNNPVILNETGHFVAAYASEMDKYKIADPRDQARNELPKTHEFINSYIYTPSQTDLSYLLIAKDAGVNTVLSSTINGIVDLPFSSEYPTDNVETVYHPKLAKGNYILQFTGLPDKESKSDVYLYDKNGNPLHIQISLLPNETKKYLIIFDPDNITLCSFTEQDINPPPTPLLMSPTDDTHVKASGLILDWSDVTDPNGPVTYYYQSSWGSNGHFGPVSTGSTSQIDAWGSADNSYRWSVRACDSVGNCSNWSPEWTINIDSTPPTPPVAPSTLPNPTNQTTQSWSWTESSDNVMIQGYYSRIHDIVGSTVSDWLYLGNVLGANTELANGLWEMQLSAQDLAGNRSYGPYSPPLLVDLFSPSTPTVLGFLNPNLGCNSTTDAKNITVYWSQATDTNGVAGYEYQISYPYEDGSGRGEWTTNMTTTSYSGHLNEGRHDIRVRAYDQAKNYSNWSEYCSITYKVNPQSIITKPSNPGNGATIYLNNWDGKVAGTASDGGAGVEKVSLSIYRNSDNKYWNGFNWVSGSEETTRVTATGRENWEYVMPYIEEYSYKISSHAVDKAGNTENSYVLNLVWDKTAPLIKLLIKPLMPGNFSGWYKIKPLITLELIDLNKDVIKYRWDSEDGPWFTYGSPINPPSSGHHKLYYQAWDKAGNSSEIFIKNIKWDSTKLSQGPKEITGEVLGASDKQVIENQITRDNDTKNWYLVGSASCLILLIILIKKAIA